MSNAAGPGPPRWLLTLITILVPLFVQEAMFRFVFPIPEVTNFNRVNYTDILRSEFAKRPYIMNAAFLWISKPDGAGFVINLNLYGFRDVDRGVQRRGGVSRVLFVGDSFTEGFMATDRETIPAGFGMRAKRDGVRVEAMNLGLGASGIANYSALIRDAVPLFRPDAVVVVLYGNDLPPPSFDPGWWTSPLQPVRSRPWIPRVVEVLRRALHRQVVPRRWRAKARPFVPALPDPMNPWASPSMAAKLRSFVDPAIARAMEKAEFNPFAANLLGEAEISLREKVDVTDHLRAMQEYTRAHGAELLVVHLPYAVQISDYYVPYWEKYNFRKDIRSLRGPEYQGHARSVSRTCLMLGIPFLDLAPLLEREESRGNHLFWEYDGHMRGKGYLLVGREIFDWWRHRR